MRLLAITQLPRRQFPDTYDASYRKRFPETGNHFSALGAMGLVARQRLGGAWKELGLISIFGVRFSAGEGPLDKVLIKAKPRASFSSISREFFSAHGEAPFARLRWS